MTRDHLIKFFIFYLKIYIFFQKKQKEKKKILQSHKIGDCEPIWGVVSGQLIHEALDGVEVAGLKGRGVVGDEAQRVRVHDTPHPQASTFHWWDEDEEEKNMDSIGINSNHSMEKDSKVSSYFFFSLESFPCIFERGEDPGVSFLHCERRPQNFSFFFFSFFWKNKK